jgi:hypothetical protein
MNHWLFRQRHPLANAPEFFQFDDTEEQAEYQEARAAQG